MLLKLSVMDVLLQLLNFYSQTGLKCPTNLLQKCQFCKKVNFVDFDNKFDVVVVKTELLARAASGRFLDNYLIRPC